MKPMRLSIIGFGAVGQGVARALINKLDELKKSGIYLNVVAISDSHGSYVNPEGIDLEAALQRKVETGSVATLKISSIEVIQDVEHDLMIDVTPTNIDDGEPGLSYILEAFNRGRHVVTSNKGPLALKYGVLCDEAKKNGVQFRFEATVGGAMPILNLAKDALAGNRIIGIEGILNGTCNYILSRMFEEGLSYKHVLGEAQELGIAETDPTYDVEGIDTACKLVILANSIFGMDVTYDDVEITGITKITAEALTLAGAEGMVIKLIGEVRDGDDTILRVAPRLVPKSHPLVVGGTLNVALLKTDMAGPISVTGRGAGSMETASAILSDVIAIYKSSS
ncbi:MAG TPA: homoserine dehydrogenase [Candidatus Nanoarchaeia archaeon]|nr:homoserine dehydrogenase [Candidatus Nanoarchaeia archaeon]